MSQTLNLNFRQVAEQDKPVEQGTYPVIVKKCEYKAAKDQGGYPYFAARFEITDGPAAGRPLFINMTTNPEETQNGSQKNFMLFQFLKHIGYDVSTGELSVTPEEICAEAINKPLNVVVNVKDEQNNVSRILATNE